MKNKILGLLLMLLCLMPFNALAKEYNATNLDQALKEEGIEHDFSDYKETDDQVIVYVFRGKGCGFCKKLLTFLNTLIPEHGHKFKVVTYETWYDNDNAELLEEVRKFMGNDGRGVPFIVIGEDFFPGYNEDFDEAIIQSIERQYESSDRYDVLEELAKAQEEAEKEAKKGQTNEVVIILFNLLFTVISTGAIMIYISVNNKKLLEAVNSKKSK